MSLKVLLVDDEFLVRLGIKSLINWDKHNFVYVGDAGDGLEALDIIERTRPDIILTDIIMPRMNGLELIEKVKLDYPDTHIIVLSSHNEYEYVRKAMKLGVDDYILKASLKPEELLQMLLEVYDKVEASRRAIHQQGELAAASSADDKDSSHIIRHWLEHPLHRESMDDATMMELEDSLLLLFKLHRSSHIRAGVSNAQKLMNLIELQIKKRSSEIIHMEEENELILLLPAEDEAVSLSRELINASKRYLNIHISVGISAQFSGIEQIHHAYTQARAAVQKSFYEGKDKVYIYSEQLDNQPMSNLISKEDERLLRIELERMNVDGIKQVLQLIFDGMQSARGPVDKSIQVCLQLLYMIQNTLKPCNDELFKHFEDEVPLYRQVLGFEELDEAKEWFDELVDFCFVQGKAMTLGSTREEIQQLILYMKSHYAENLSLRQAAQMVKMSENYLSYLFKKEAQVSFTDYLNQIRVDKAAQLLLETKLPVYVIAEKVGYENFNYFGRIFKKVKGLSPQQFRQKPGEFI